MSAYISETTFGLGIDVFLFKYVYIHRVMIVWLLHMDLGFKKSALFYFIYGHLKMLASVCSAGLSWWYQAVEEKRRSQLPSSTAEHGQ